MNKKKKENHGQAWVYQNPTLQKKNEPCMNNGSKIPEHFDHKEVKIFF